MQEDARLDDAEGHVRHAQEDEFRLALEAWGLGSWAWDLVTYRLTWSHTLPPLLGLPPDGFGGTLRAFLQTVHPADRPAVQRAIARAARRGEEMDEEFRVVWPDGTVRWIAGKGRVYLDATGRPRRVLGVGMDVTYQVSQRQRQEAALRIARSVAAESDPQHVLGILVDEATLLTDATMGAVYRWDESQNCLIAERFDAPGVERFHRCELGEGLAGRAAQQRAPIVANDYQAEIGSSTLAGRLGARAGMGIPLLHEGRLLGSLAIATSVPSHTYSAADLETLEVMAAITSAALIALERSRLQGVLLAARTAEHELNNSLALTVGYCELLQNDPRLPSELREWAFEAERGARSASRLVQQFGRVTNLAEVNRGNPSGALLDLDRSVSQAQENR